MALALARLTGQVGAQPAEGALPGTQVLKSLTNGLDYWALLAALAGLLVGAALWGLGHYSQNFHQAHNGKRGVLVSGTAALIIGAAPAIINFFASAGSRVGS
jgi:uncharacterized protein DUF6112